MFRNQALNLSEGRISVIQGVFERPQPTLLLRVTLNKSRILAWEMLQARPRWPLMTTARSRRFSGYCLNQKTRLKKQFPIFQEKLLIQITQHC